MHPIKRIPKQVQDYFNSKYPTSEGYAIGQVYWYYGGIERSKYYGIQVMKNGNLDSIPQATLEEYATHTH